MILPIRLFGDPILRAPAQEVAGVDEEVRHLVDDMVDTMRAAAGLGLAAPQVGRRERVFVVDLGAVDEDWGPEPMVLINPHILWESLEDAEFEEGCLSIPDVREMVVRPAQVRLSYRDRAFVRHELEAGDLLARVIQHEYDHLDGVLFIDLISPFRRSLLRRRLREIARGEVEAEYAVTSASR